MAKKIWRVLPAAVSVFIMVAIFILSSQTGAESEMVSGGMLSGMEPLLLKIFKTGERLEKISGALEFVIRKSAHAFIYFCLGCSVSLTLKNWEIKNKRLLITVCFCFLYAVSDEFHQLFVDGRSAELRDVLIDTIGSFLGALTIYFSDSSRRRRGP